THSIIIEPDRAKAIQIAVGQSSAGDILLVAGKGHENYQIIGTDKFHFDDFEQLQKYQR
ncbi:MAG: UDP-N-acetylmuramoyl-L-alanyl-D-glutamate--2,6-diaminopimelate ligase, partial [Candidatus Kapabacteria bacterium]|nr:UDP-N-acetylmuramoyl-L-alanyl-D-glutamate--2,6-diaminopimelate ligase [Candidatus Kapabacteria bacterium]